MALYESINGIARKITKKYDGVAAVSRKITKAYDGVNGVARQFFNGFNGVLYDHGDECTDITGGWSKGAYTRGSNTTITKNAENITLYVNGMEQTITVLTNDPIDVTDYSAMYVEVDYTATNANGHFTTGLSDTRTTSSDQSFEQEHMRVACSWGTSSGTIAVDLSGVSGSYYPFICLDRWSRNSTGTLVIKKIWLE